MVKETVSTLALTGGIAVLSAMTIAIALLAAVH
jgi:hypothetical protein